MKFNELLDFQQNNLQTLLAGMRNLYGDKSTADTFSMVTYCGIKSVNGSPYYPTHYPEMAVCGTCCCLIGHGPQLGIKPDPGEDWFSYAYKFLLSDDENEFYFLFSAMWPSDIQEAIARLDLFVNQNFDPTTDWKDCDYLVRYTGETNDNFNQ